MEAIKSDMLSTLSFLDPSNDDIIERVKQPLVPVISTVKGAHEFTFDKYPYKKKTLHVEPRIFVVNLRNSGWRHAVPRTLKHVNAPYGASSEGIATFFFDND